jgi:hypothetical protein
MIEPDPYPLGSQLHPCAEIGLNDPSFNDPDQGMTPT